MKIVSLLTKLEDIRINANDPYNEDVAPYQIIDVLVDYIGNEKIREKIDEIPF